MKPIKPIKSLYFTIFFYIFLFFVIFSYAHIEVVVAFLVVNFLSFLVRNRKDATFEGRHQVEMNPTDLPQLFKPKFEGSNPSTTSKLEV